MLFGPRQRLTGISIVGSSTNNSVAFVQHTFGALYLLVKIWGADVATAPQSSAVRVTWDGAASSGNIAGSGTAGSGVGAGIYFTSPSGIALNLAENLGYPVYFWYNPTPLITSTVGFGSAWTFPFPSVNVRLVGNAAAANIVLNADIWCVYPDRPQSSLRYTDANTLPFVGMPG